MPSLDDIPREREKDSRSVNDDTPVHIRRRWVRCRRKEEEDEYEAQKANRGDVDWYSEGTEAELGCGKCLVAAEALC